MKIYLSLLFVMLLALRGNAQATQSRVILNISYFGILGTHPGIKVGVQYPLITFKRQEEANSLNQIVGAANLLFYYHRRNQIGVGLTAELGFRNRRRQGMNSEVFLGGGYLRTFVPRRVYDFDSGNGLTPRRLPGAGHLLLTGALGLGKNLERSFDSDFWTVKPSLLFIRPFGAGSTLNFAIDAGFQWH